MPDKRPSLYIGLMSGTSLDGVDGVLADFPGNANQPAQTAATSYRPFPPVLREELMALQSPGDNEIHREALAANALAGIYAECVAELLVQHGTDAACICAIGVHGQTIRHQPESGYTRQVNNPALLAELTGIDVVADLRSRDIAAGGQGAPLTPAFHLSAFGAADEVRVIANIGGIANISVLGRGNHVIGFDTGPGNVLMDMWIARHLQRPYDEDGAWAASGKIVLTLLSALLDEPFFNLPPPKSTGRDLFHAEWLASKLKEFNSISPPDVQATLAAFTATSLANAIAAHAREAKSVFVCGGGAYNAHLMRLLQALLNERGLTTFVKSTAALGVPPNHVEALAFAWLAYRHVNRLAGNLAAVTGARGERILGALYPA
jgi:anhydro-N-acetylmuramic acid kinase